MQGDIVDQGLELMLFGMGTVLVFLTVLVFAIGLMSWVIRRYFPEPDAPTRAAGPTRAAAPGVADANLIAVISAAIHRHRARKPPTPGKKQ